MKELIYVGIIFSISVLFLLNMVLPNANFLLRIQNEETVDVTETQNYLSTPYLARFEKPVEQQLTNKEVEIK